MRQRQIYRALFISLLLVVMAGCASMQSARHQYLMRGQVVEKTGTEVVVCVGSGDGARAGQQLDVYKITIGSGRQYARVKVGSVRIAEVLDEHFARAQVTDGAVEVYNLVELGR